MPGFLQKIIIILILLSIILGVGIAIGQKVSRISYIVPKIETEDESLKEFEKTMRRHLDDIAKRIDDLERRR